MKIFIKTYALTMRELQTLSGGELILHGMEEAPAFTSICTDSREADASTLFVALKGDRADGHDYMSRTTLQGCRCFLCDHLPADMTGEDAPPYAALVVPDVIAALAPPAGAHMARSVCLTHAVAVTGSVGKTTTKEAIAGILSPAFSLFKKDGNYNSLIGLPLSLMEITPEHNAAVLEMGMSAPGEISVMSRLVRPDVAVITNVGVSHLGMLGSRENIARAKLEVACGLREGGTLIIPYGEPLLESRLASDVSPDVRILRVSMTDPAADFCAVATGARTGENGGGMSFDLKLPDGTWRDLYFPSLGHHSVLIAAFAAAAAWVLGLKEEDVRAGLLAYRPAAMRQSLRRVGSVTLLEDCYNAAPDSMRAALDVLGLAAQGGRRVAVLGDMKELGDTSAALHRGVGQACAHGGTDVLVTVGTLGAEIAGGALEGGMPDSRVYRLCADTNENGGSMTPDEIAARLAGVILPGDTVLFKASRSMQFEKISAALASRLS